MLDYSNPFLQKLREAGQGVGVLRPVVRAYRRLAGKSYEDGFDKALLAEARPDDTVWDVGANVGFYSCRLATRVGTGGRVVAFEPSPRTLVALRSAVSELPQVTVVNAALSNFKGTADYVDDADNHHTNSLRGSAASGAPTVQVDVGCGDDYAEEYSPAIIKIDVEGLELEVVEGLRKTLTNPKLRALFIEVHFLELSKRGLRDGAARLKASLEAAGLSVRWIDPSHIVARRLPV